MCKKKQLFKHLAASNSESYLQMAMDSISGAVMLMINNRQSFTK